MADQDFEGFERWRFQHVLDHGAVLLVDSMPHWTMESGDHRVVNAARVSFGKGEFELPPDIMSIFGLDQEAEERTPLENAKLIHYLMSHRHTTPFEKVRFEFMAKLPIFVARQWIRHRMGSFNEVSARYSKLPNEFYLPALERMQAQHEKNKQASGEPLPTERAERLQRTIRTSSENAYSDYESLLGGGLARELARMVLPTNFYTQWYWTVDLKNFLDFARLRADGHAQYEIRVYAEAMLKMVERIAPVTVQAWNRHARGA